MAVPTSPPPLNPTPPQEDHSNGAYASYVPHDLRYSSDFEDSLMRIALDPNNTAPNGIRVIPNDSTEQPESGVSVRATDVSLESLPIISEDELPLALSDSRRVFASPIPGVRLTHPGGYLEGGPGLDPEMDTFPDDFFQNNPSLTTTSDLHQVVKVEVETSIEALKERLRARQAAKDKNEQIEKELKQLMDEHSMEQKIYNKMAEEKQRKQAAREQRRKDRQGG